MSLVGVFRCGDSAVLLADSQETYGSVKTQVEKIDLYDDEQLRRQVAFSAATSCPDLAKSLSAQIGRWTKQSAVHGTEGIRAELADIVATFHGSDEFTNYPLEQSDKAIDGFVCVSTLPWPIRSVDVFRVSRSTVQVVNDWALTGVDYQHVDQIARRRYRRSMSIPEALVLGLYLFRAVERVSTSVGPPMKVAIVQQSGIHLQDQALTDLHHKHFVDIIETLEDVIFAAPNLQETDQAMTERWTATCNSMTAMRGLFRQDIGTYHQSQIDKLPPEAKALLKRQD